MSFPPPHQTKQGRIRLSMSALAGLPVGTTLGLATYGEVTNTRDPRILQLALKLTF